MPRVSSKVASFTESVIREMTRLALDQYAITWGAKCFRDAIAAKVERTYAGWAVDPETELTVTCGATEGVVASCLALLDPGDEVVVFEPWYENYWPDTVISGAVPRFVTLHEPDWSIDEAELRAAFGPRTRAIIVNTPNNPTGKVHDFLTVGAAAPLQEGGVAAMNLPASYYEQLNEGYRQRRDLFCPALDKIGLAPMVP